MRNKLNSVVFCLLTLTLTLTLQGCNSGASPSPFPTPPPECYTAPEATTLDTGWRFRTDPDDQGRAQGWQEPELDDTDWRSLAPGEPWEESGLTYDGAAWYRTRISLPDWPSVYLGFGLVDDDATLWVDGERAGQWSTDGRGALVDLLEFGEAGEEIQLAFRVWDEGGYGGIKQPVRIGAEPQAVMTEAQYVSRLAEAHPDWPMPGWARDRAFAWTMTGDLDAADEALVSVDGAVVPAARAPTVEAWLYEPETGHLIAAPQGDLSFALAKDALPIPRWRWSGSGVTLENVLFHDQSAEALRWGLTVQGSEGANRDLVLLLAVRPFALHQGMAPIYALGWRAPAHLQLNGEPFMTVGTEPERAGVGRLEEAMDAASQGDVPARSIITCTQSGDAAAILAYPLRLGLNQTANFQFAFPDSGSEYFPDVSVESDVRLEEAISLWEEETGQMQLDLPDDQIVNAVQASIGYILIALDPAGPEPGPLAHDSLWVRDAAYVGLALLQAGHADRVKAYIPKILEAQEDDGRIPPILGENIPWDVDEWDSQGQAIFLVTSYYRYTEDYATLREWYPVLHSSAEFIVDLRASQSDVEGPTRGLLPPSKSAEDLGDEERHYYWDDFWAVMGLEEAAYAARELGYYEDAAWMEAEAEELRQAILRSVEAVMGEDPSYIPGAVEEIESSAAARGTVSALWPMEVLPREMPLVERSFDYYYQQWIAPSEGGFVHRKGQFWPYGGMELAHVYLRLGRMDVLHEILGWTLTNQTLPGTFAWAEQVNPSNNGFSGGDMPHAWAASSLVTLVREMVFFEREGYLALFEGVPDWWLETDRTINIEDAPTTFGPLNLRTESTVQQGEAGWDGTLTLTLTGASPPEGFRWRLPHSPAAVNGPPGTKVEDGWLFVPTRGGTVQLTFVSE
jgi:hypothetical protein